METYIVNGVAIEYDTFDLVNMELFGTEVERLKDFADSINGKQYNAFADSVADLREMCEGIKDFFDCVVGEGTSEKVFGTRVNALDMTQAYHNFVAEVSARMQNGFSAPVAPAMNREQRRAAEREQRRAEAAARAEAKRHAE